jgi:hypothetical protein
VTTLQSSLQYISINGTLLFFSPVMLFMLTLFDCTSVLTTVSFQLLFLRVPVVTIAAYVIKLFVKHGTHEIQKRLLYSRNETMSNMLKIIFILTRREIVTTMVYHTMLSGILSLTLYACDVTYRTQQPCHSLCGV